MSNGGHSGRPIHLCLTGGWFDSPNVGDNALLLGIIESIGRAAPARFTVLTPDPARLGSLYGLPALAPRKHPIRLVGLLWSVDGLVFTGGSPFFDHVVHMLYCAALAAVARLAGVKVVVWAIWLRPLRNRLCRTLVRFICRRATYLSGRNAQTVKGLSELVGGEIPVEFVPDPATRLTPLPKEQARALLSEQGIEPGCKAVAICMRGFEAGAAFGVHHYDCRFSSEEVDAYLDAVRELVRTVLLKTDRTILFLPMHTVEPDDDRIAAMAVVDGLESGTDRQRVKVVIRQYQAREMKAVLGLMDAVVGVRFHSLLLASSMGTPVISLSHASKNESIMDLIGQREHLVRLQEVSGNWLSRHVLEVLSQQDRIRAALKERYAAFAVSYERHLSRMLTLIGASGQQGPLSTELKLRP
mgnify:CR=1 FL=1